MNLYTFTVGTTVTRYTTAKANVILDGNTYTTQTMKRSSYALDMVAKKNSLKIIFSGDNDLARQFIAPTESLLTVSIALLTGVVFFRGKLVAASYTPANMIELLFEPDLRLGQINMAERRIFQLNCPYILYGKNCRAEKVGLNFTITNIVNSFVVDIQYDTGSASNTSEYVLPTVLPDKRASIYDVSGGTVSKDGNEWWIISLVAMTPFTRYINARVTFFTRHSLVVNDSVIVEYGCRRTSADCSDVHSNLLNYGGFNIRRESPFNDAIEGR